MQVIVRPSERSTPERPLYFCRLYEYGRCVAMGSGPTAEAAELEAWAQLAERQEANRKTRLGGFWEEDERESGY